MLLANDWKGDGKANHPSMHQMLQGSTTRPFTHVELDYCGPFQRKERQGRSKSILKGYVANFVCFSCKAVHLEMVSNLTTKTLQCAIRRFMA